MVDGSSVVILESSYTTLESSLFLSYLFTPLVDRCLESNNFCKHMEDLNVPCTRLLQSIEITGSSGGSTFDRSKKVRKLYSSLSVFLNGSFT